MSDTPISASADLSGNGATSAPAAAPEGTPPSAAPAEAWYSGMGFDQDTIGWMENRGLTKLDQSEALKNALSGFRNAEKFLGVPKDQLLRLPNFDTAEQTELDQFYNKLGRPADAKGYELPVPEGAPTEYADYMKEVFHKAGITAKQAKILAEANNEFGAKIGQATEQQKLEMNKTQQESLRKEWGEAYDAQMGTARYAFQELGVDAETVDKLQDAMGFDGVMKFFANLGSKFGEGRFVSGGASSNGPMTPNQAQAQIRQLQNDVEFGRKLTAGNAEAKALWDRLHRFAFPS